MSAPIYRLQAQSPKSQNTIHRQHGSLPCKISMSAVTFGYVSIQGLDEEGMEGAHMLCMADAPEAKEEAVALWAWLRMQWALGLTETWAKTSRNEVRGTLSCCIASCP